MEKNNKEIEVGNLSVNVNNPMHYVVEDDEGRQDKVKSKFNKLTLTFVLGIVAIVSLSIALIQQVNENKSLKETESSPEETIGEERVDDEGVFLSSFVHLFEWKWSDIEKECVEFLGPKGFTAVQISPPNEHVDHKQVEQFPWWVRYQPVSYDIISRSGTRDSFISMVNTCKSVGVGIYVDAILNHMAGLPFVSEGVGGTPYDANNKQFKDFSPIDFHSCSPPDIQGGDYGSSAERVRLCQLVGLPDLDQSKQEIRDKQTAYLQDLVDIGVAGFRLDAAKHMYPDELKSIIDNVVGDFYVFSEVIDYGVDPISVDEYTPFSDGTDFRYERDVVDRFTNGNLANLLGLGEYSGYVASEDAVVFIDNHDTERADPKLTYRDGARYEIANAFMLSWNFGYPKVLSGYEFGRGNFDQGPPSDEVGNTNDIHKQDGSIDCFEGRWTCTHRLRSMGNMAQFRKYVMEQEANDIGYTWTDGGSSIAYARVGSNGSAGFVVINKGGSTGNTYQTGMPDGVYCDVIDGDFVNGRCTGRSVVVKDNGYLQVNVDGLKAFAIHGGARIS